MTQHSARGTGSALEAMYRFILWLIPAVEKFPRALAIGIKRGNKLYIEDEEIDL